ncbi:hypothetical protein GCM10023116_33780 [Kistimonas scapharcae]|uniref:Uncharacterized protein n=1 Tax=Kistimonas scapharcae TaxID=1036133 RepID=A0ABP8V7S9_9GAMM
MLLIPLLLEEYLVLVPGRLLTSHRPLMLLQMKDNLNLPPLKILTRRMSRHPLILIGHSPRYQTRYEKIYGGIQHRRPSHRSHPLIVKKIHTGIDKQIHLPSTGESYQWIVVI